MTGPRVTPTHLRRRPLVECAGAICVISGDRSTWPQFSECLWALAHPAGSQLFWRHAAAGELATGRNNLVAAALKMNAEWCFMLDDDHTFAPDTLLRLLRHDVDIVQCHVADRHPPFASLVFRHYDIPTDATDTELAALVYREDGPARLAPQQRGLVEAGSVGAGGVLVSMDVFRALAAPWFEFGHLCGWRDEDMWLFARARRAAFKTYVDLDTRIGHLATCAVWPTAVDGRGTVAPAFDWRCGPTEPAAVAAPRCWSGSKCRGKRPRSTWKN